MFNAFTLAAGVAQDYNEVGKFFRLLAAPSTDIQIQFYLNGAIVSEAVNVGAGYAESFEKQFDKLSIKSTGGGAVAYVTRIDSQVRYDTPPAGQVTINSSGPVTHMAKTVTNASTSMLAAKSNRKYLMIQNKDAAGIVYICFGAAATVANGIKIPPGGSYAAESGFIPNQEVFAIGDLATQSNVVAVEG